MKRGMEAVNDSFKTNKSIKRIWEGYDAQGVKWIGYGKGGQPTSFFPDDQE